YPVARDGSEVTGFSVPHRASRPGRSLSVCDASTPAPATACTGLLSVSLRISVITSMLRYIGFHLSRPPCGRPCSCAGGRAPDVLVVIPVVAPAPDEAGGSLAALALPARCLRRGAIPAARVRVGRVMPRDLVIGDAEHLGGSGQPRAV